LHCIVDGEEQLLVLDPFMGSGTVAVSAIKHNCDYIGFEKFQQYVDLSNEKILGNA
jgi:DNA modification methylase